MSRSLNIAVVGAPNSGKTTLYNWLTGSKYKTVNYPGATVEFAVGSLNPALIEKFQLNSNKQIQFFDTPGIYSLNPKSADEEVTYNLVVGQQQHPIDFILLVVDETQLNRQLLIAEQLQKSGIPFQIIFMMDDLASKEGLLIQRDQLVQSYGQKNVLVFDGLFGAGLEEVLRFTESLESQKYQIQEIGFDKKSLDQLQKQAQKKYRDFVKIERAPSQDSPLERTLRIDQIVLHPVWGLFLFFTVMTLLFASVYWMATPFMDWIDAGVSAFSDVVKNNVAGLAGQFLSDGIIAAIGGVIIFIPQIFILFLGIGLLENSGYLARIATLVDRPLSKIGLGGRAFVPLLSGFACAVPAIMATRNIQSKKQKMLAQFIIPFLTCSARLPVYGLIIGFLFTGENNLLSGFVLAVLYFVAILISAIISGIFSRLVQNTERPMLSMDLPYYRRPQFKIIFKQSVDKSKSFLKRAGPVIFILAIVLWFATQFPRPENADQLTSAEITEQSYAGQLGQKIQPLFEPMGLDWRAGFGVISSFAAREVFVSSLSLVFNIEGEEDAQIEGLIKAMKSATFQSGSHQGEPIFTVASSIGILIFFMLALQCLSTYAILKQESGGHKLALLQLVFSNVFAYALAVAVVQGLRLIGIA